VTNTGLNIVRDAFITDSYPAIDTVKLGDSNNSLSRANTDIDGNTLATGGLSDTDVSTSDAVTFTFDVQPAIGDVREIGLFTDTGKLFARMVTDTPINIDDVQVSITIQNDPGLGRGVFTQEGITMVRDIIANNTPNERNAYAFGSDTTEVSESDVALFNETTDFNTGSISFANATSASEFESIGPDLSGDVTLEYGNGGIKRVATGGWIEIPGDEFGSNLATTVSGQHSGGTALELSSNGADVLVQFGLEYDPANEYLGRFRGSLDNFTGDVQLIDENFNVIDSFSTEDNNNKNVTLDSFFVQNPSGDVVRGIRVNNVQQGSIQVDGFEFFDFDNAGGNAGSFNTTTNTYPGPELFGGTTLVTFPTFTSPRETDTVTVQSTWNDVSNAQFLELTDGNNETIRADNTANHTFNFAETSEQFTLSINLDEFAGDPSTTPTEAGDAQLITALSVTSGLVNYAPDGIGTVELRALLEPNVIDGTTVAEGGIKDTTGGDLLTRVRYAEFQVLANQRLVGNEIISIKNNTVG